MGVDVSRTCARNVLGDHMGEEIEATQQRLKAQKLTEWEEAFEASGMRKWYGTHRPTATPMADAL